ncbi:MAG: hypothetical protein H8Z69_05475 [Nanohaloarchaea archaeon]|nr:hypothetical protein [Candidatus Nanohaloarchaea archaeon]
MDWENHLEIVSNLERGSTIAEKYFDGVDKVIDRRYVQEFEKVEGDKVFDYNEEEIRQLDIGFLDRWVLDPMPEIVEAEEFMDVYDNMDRVTEYTSLKESVDPEGWARNVKSLVETRKQSPLGNYSTKEDGRDEAIRTIEDDLVHALENALFGNYR